MDKKHKTFISETLVNKKLWQYIFCLSLGEEKSFLNFLLLSEHKNTGSRNKTYFFYKRLNLESWYFKFIVEIKICDILVSQSVIQPVTLYGLHPSNYALSLFSFNLWPYFTAQVLPKTFLIKLDFQRKKVHGVICIRVSTEWVRNRKTLWKNQSFLLDTLFCI